MTLSPRQIKNRIRQAWDENALILKAISFGMIGGINFLIDFSIFSFGYYGLGLSILTANCISWSISVTNSYVMNSMITFAKESGRKLGVWKYAGFVLMQSLGFLANTSTVVAASYFVPVWAGKVLAVGASFAVNFTLTHFVVFQRSAHGKARSAKARR